MGPQQRARREREGDSPAVPHRNARKDARGRCLPGHANGIAAESGGEGALPFRRGQLDRGKKALFPAGSPVELPGDARRRRGPQEKQARRPGKRQRHRSAQQRGQGEPAVQERGREAQLERHPVDQERSGGGDREGERRLEEQVQPAHPEMAAAESPELAEDLFVHGPDSSMEPRRNQQPFTHNSLMSIE